MTHRDRTPGGGTSLRCRDKSRAPGSTIIAYQTPTQIFPTEVETALGPLTRRARRLFSCRARLAQYLNPRSETLSRLRSHPDSLRLDHNRLCGRPSVSSSGTVTNLN